METPTVSSSVKKTLVESLTKSSLTPCRRPGLSRPSSSILNKSCRKDAACTPNTDIQRTIILNRLTSEPSVDSTPTLNCDESHKVPLKINDVQNKHSVDRKVRRCLAVTPLKVGKTDGDVLENALVGEDSRTCKKIKLSLKRINGDEKVEDCSKSDFEDSTTLGYSEIPSEKIDEVDDSGAIVTPEVIEKLVRSIQEKKKKLEQLKVQETYAKKHNLEELRAQTAKWKKAGQEALVYSVNLAKHAGYSVTTKQLMSQHGFSLHLMGYNSENDDFE